jgi:hypothetical protein
VIPPPRQISASGDAMFDKSARVRVIATGNCKFKNKNAKPIVIAIISGFFAIVFATVIGFNFSSDSAQTDKTTIEKIL